jgi:hypothetical protein
MRQLTCVISIVLGVAVLAPTPAVADPEVVTVTAAAQGLFSAPAALGPVVLDRLEVGTGVFIDADGSAMGQFHAVLHGVSLPGQARDVIVEGRVVSGSLAENGSVTFSGIATLDMGAGAMSLLGLPFAVTASTDGLQLVLDATSLPPVTLPGGSIVIE